MEKSKRLPRLKALEAISKELEEIESELDWQGFPSDAIAEGEPVSGETVGESEGDEREKESEMEEDDRPNDKQFNAEDVEVAIDVFVSHLVKATIIRLRADTATSFSGVFLTYFGADHRITKLAEAFEETVQGYFGAIHYNDAKEASEQLIEIRKILNEELVRSGHN